MERISPNASVMEAYSDEWTTLLEVLCLLTLYEVSSSRRCSSQIFLPLQPLRLELHSCQRPQDKAADTPLAYMPSGFPICVTLRLHTRPGCQSVRKTGSDVIRQNIHMASLTGASVMMACVTLLWSISSRCFMYVLMSRYRMTLPLFSLHPQTRPWTEKQIEPYVGPSVNTFCRSNLSYSLKGQFVHKSYSNGSSRI